MLTQAEREDREFRKSMIRKGMHLTHGGPPGAPVMMQTDAGMLLMRSAPSGDGRRMNFTPSAPSPSADAARLEAEAKAREIADHEHFRETYRKFG